MAAITKKKRKIHRTKLSEKIISKNSLTLKENPFDQHFNKKKFNILNRFKGFEQGKPAINRSKSEFKRKEILSFQLRSLCKESKFKDKRLLQKHKNLTQEEKSIARFATIKQKRFKRQLFNLEDDDDDEKNDDSNFDSDINFTHNGKLLALHSNYNEPVIRDKEYYHPEIDSNLQSEITSKCHFGGFNQDCGFPQYSKKEDSMQDIISNAKKEKAEKQMESENLKKLRMKLDTDWQNVRSLLALNKRCKQDDAHDADAYDIAFKSFAFSQRATAKDKLKTPEELAQEEKIKLQNLEDERLKRMQTSALDSSMGTDNVLSHSHYQSADLIPSFPKPNKNTNKKIKEVMLSYDESGNIASEDIRQKFESHEAISKPMKLPFNRLNKKSLFNDNDGADDSGATDDDDDDDEGDEDDDDDEGDEDDDYDEDANDDSSDYEENENSDGNNDFEPHDGEDDVTSSVYEEEEDDEVNSLYDENDDDMIKEDITNSCCDNNDEDKDKLSDGNTHLKSILKKSKLNLPNTKVTSITLNSNIQNEFKESECNREEIPFTFTMPETFESFRKLLDLYKTKDRFGVIIVDRLITCYHPQLKENNKVLLQRLCSFYVDFLMSEIALFNKDSAKRLFEALPKIVEVLRKFANFNEVQFSQTLSDVIFREIHSKTHLPTYCTLLISRIVVSFYSISDFQHKVVTPTLSLLALKLPKDDLSTLSQEELLVSISTSSLIQLFVKDNLRCVPEVIHFFSSLFQMMNSHKTSKKSHTSDDTCTNKATVESADSSICDNNTVLFALKVFEEFLLTYSKTNLKSVFTKFLTPLNSIMSHSNSQDVKILLEKIINSISDLNNTNSSHTQFDEETKEQSSTLVPFNVKRRQIVSIPLFEPKFEDASNLDVVKHRGSLTQDKTAKERQKVLHKIKRATKTAKRELRRDADFLAKEKNRVQSMKDKERRQKVKKLFGILSNQEGEYRKFLRTKK